MTKTILSLGAGCAHRFHEAGFKDTIKYLLMFNGESLVERQWKQFPDMILITRPHQPVPGFVQVIRSVCFNNTIHTLGSVLWRCNGNTLILLADVYYTDKLAKELNKAIEGDLGSTVHFWGDGYERFAMAFGPAGKQAVWPLVDRLAKKRRGKLSHLFSDMITHKLDAKMHLVRDMTQDFDTPEDVDNFITGRSFKNQLYKETLK